MLIGMSLLDGPTNLLSSEGTDDVDEKLESSGGSERLEDDKSDIF